MTRGVSGITRRLVNEYMHAVLPKNIADALHVSRAAAFVVDGDEIKLRKVRLTLD
jgi:hypothetical protein